MTVEIEDIRNGLIANLASITGCQKSAYRTGNETPPALIVIGFDAIEPTTFQGGGYSIPMLIQGIAGEPTKKSAEMRLDRWLSPAGAENVWGAIESDPTLGGIVDDLAVTLCDGSQVITLDNGTDVLGSTWHIQIEI